MGGLWAGIWRSRGRAAGVGILLSVAIASALYSATWRSFYDTRGLEANRRADEIAADIELLAAGTDAGPGRDTAFRRALLAYLARRAALVTVTRPSRAGAGWAESNRAPVDESRTLVERAYEIEAGGGSTEPLTVGVVEAVRPPLATALLRAWSFSLVDARADPERWWSDRLYNRSLPLYAYWLVVLAVGARTVRSLHRNQLELDRLGEEAGAVGAEIDILRGFGGSRRKLFTSNSRVFVSATK